MKSAQENELGALNIAATKNCSNRFEQSKSFDHSCNCCIQSNAILFAQMRSQLAPKLDKNRNINSINKQSSNLSPNNCNEETYAAYQEIVIQKPEISGVHT